MEGFDADDLIEILRVRCQERGTQRAWAKDHGVSPAYVNDVLQGRREISDNFAALLGFERRVIFLENHSHQIARGDR
jgi:hypothetical protein